MSRVGRKPIATPAGVKVSVSNGTVSIEGPKGRLSMEHRPEVSVSFDEAASSIGVTVDEEKATQRQVRAYWGLTRSLLSNMVEGVTNGYERSLVVEGSGWGAELQGQKLKLNVGFAKAVMVDVPADLQVGVERQTIKINGADKQQVGQFAAVVRSVRKPEPYNGKGIRYSDEVVRRKQGKQLSN